VRHQRSQRIRPLEHTPAWKNNGHPLILRLPGNQTLQLDLTERALEIAGLPPALDGLSVVHLSDLHFTGHVPKAYFQEVVRQSNQFEPDLVAVTGDFLEHSANVDWIPDTLGRLESRYGVYCVLGNHDTKADAGLLRRTLTDSGLVDLGSRWVEIRVEGRPIVLAGNELPWFPPAADLTGAPGRAGGDEVLRIALSHSPDQLGWARANDVDLMLAGHTHGGQIRLPLVGAILTPSRTGVKYSHGVFHDPPTVLHVSRGISGEYPLRVNCPPEITRLVLHAKGPAS
jgi:predicted MPP superfamily phosphohydrolase